MTKQVHLAAHFPGVNNTTVWSDPAAGSHIEFDSFVHFAQTAERGLFDFLFLAEGLRLREHGGEIYDLDVVGRPDTFTVLAALAAVTEHLGLAGTINSTFNEPFEVARQFASLDHLSDGRAAWNVVTSWDEFTGENFRRGGYLPEDQRYVRARRFLETALQLWDSWSDDDVAADRTTGTFLADPAAGAFTRSDKQFDIAGRFPVPRSPQGRPVIFQAGDSEEGREFAAAHADAIFSRHSTLDDGVAFYADVKGRLAVLTGDVGQPREGRLVAAGRVRTVLVVLVNPIGEGIASFLLAAVTASVGPPVSHGAVEALNLAVGLRTVRARPLRRDRQGLAGIAPQMRAVRAAVVR